MQIMKNLKISTLIILICFLLCSCYDGDPYKGKRPIENPNSYWVCEEYETYFSVSEDKKITDAQITVQDQSVPLELMWFKFDNGITVGFETDTHRVRLLGYCKFNENEFTIEIEKTAGFFPEEQIVMEFDRKTEEEYSSYKNNLINQE